MFIHPGDDDSIDEHWDDEHLVDSHSDSRPLEIDERVLALIYFFVVDDNRIHCPTMMRPHYSMGSHQLALMHLWKLNNLQLQLLFMCTHNPALARPKPHACDRLSIQKCIPIT